jgi:glucose/arabinose dehydrogenase
MATNSTKRLSGLRLGTFGLLAGLLMAAQPALAQRPASQANPLDKSDLGRSKQDPDLKGVPVPVTVTPLDKVQLNKIKVPAGFKVDVYAHGMPGARTMLRGEKGTIFVGSRTIGRVYAITEKDGKRDSKIILQGLKTFKLCDVPRSCTND